ncbi:MAG: MaoC family dehydratase [Microscillaceae bacterium]|nr:MaoC family dehydratase [Microscillaceae bacterium]MDW8460370.1 MaoC family dehydratase [Cytophagales bacterium]
MIQLNQEFRHTFQFSQAEVEQFASVTGDCNPIHLDAEYAAQTIFKKPIIHGFLGGSVFSKVFGTIFPGEGTIYLKQTLEFLKPMYVDTNYEAVFLVKEINREKHRATISTQIIEKNTGNIVIQGEAIIMNKNQI